MSYFKDACAFGTSSNKFWKQRWILVVDIKKMHPVPDASFEITCYF